MFATQPPRLVARALVASFATVSLILIAVFVLIVVEVRQRVRDSVAANLDAAQDVFAEMEDRREQEMVMTVAALAESPTLKAALDTWQAERRAGGALVGEAVSTVQREVGKIAESVGADALVVVDARRAVIASAGLRAEAFVPGTAMQSRTFSPDAVVETAAGLFRVMEVPLSVNDATIGGLEHATALDLSYARQLSTLARAHTAIVVDNRVWATTLPQHLADELSRRGVDVDGPAAIVELGGESWSVRQINSVGPAMFLALVSIDAASSEASWEAVRGLQWVAVLSFLFGGCGSWWLARALTRPINQLSESLSAMAATGRFNVAVPRTGTSRELDALAGTFDTLIQSLAHAEAATQAAYLGAIRALAAALDARDPYTAGHSERVSAMSVAVGRTMHLDESEQAVLLLGGLLHDIGKIGVPDDVLQKPTALTAQEHELIRAHPVIGARILRSIPFLAPYLPIVELHHERQDGKGYPYGLRGDAIPLIARIVHVADAYDAMTSARAYRPGVLPQDAINELQRNVGTDFDPAVVEALLVALPQLPATAGGFDPAAFQWAVATRTS